MNACESDGGLATRLSGDPAGYRDLIVCWPSFSGMRGPGPSAPQLWQRPSSSVRLQQPWADLADYPDQTVWQQPSSLLRLSRSSLWPSSQLLSSSQQNA